MNVNEPKGYVIFFKQKEPVTWERETNRYVYNVKRMKKENHMWKASKKLFEEKMEKNEILNGDFERPYIPLKEQYKHN